MSTNNTSCTSGLGNTKPDHSRCRRWVFTLNNWNEEEYESIKEWLHNNTVGFVVGKEVGENGTPHLQGYFECKDGKTFNVIKKMNERAHFEKAKGNREQNIKYCTKDKDFEQWGIAKKISIREKEILMKLEEEYKDVVWKDWQKDILEMISGKPDNRAVWWIVDEKGNQGKSYLVNYIMMTQKAILADGKKTDVFNQVLQFMENDVPKIIILDIPRSNEGYVNYGVLEQLKNGVIYSGKYEGGCCFFRIPHVIVMANFWPDESKLSADRWRIVELTP